MRADHHRRPCCSISCACPSRTALVTAPLRVAALWSADRNCACAFTVQVIGPFRAPPHRLGFFHRLGSKVALLDLLRGSGVDERCAPLWCAPAHIEPLVHTCRDRSPHLLTSTDQPCSPQSCHQPALSATPNFGMSPHSDRRSLRRWQAYRPIECDMWQQCGNGRVGEWRAERVTGRALASTSSARRRLLLPAQWCTQCMDGAAPAASPCDEYVPQSLLYAMRCA